jgi:GST-like protein
MIRFYFHPTSNPAKIALFLEETGLPFEAIPVDFGKGEPHAPGFRAISFLPTIPPAA